MSAWVISRLEAIAGFAPTLGTGLFRTGEDATAFDGAALAGRMDFLPDAELTGFFAMTTPSLCAGFAETEAPAAGVNIAARGWSASGLTHGIGHFKLWDETF